MDGLTPQRITYFWERATARPAVGRWLWPVRHWNYQARESDGCCDLVMVVGALIALFVILCALGSAGAAARFAPGAVTAGIAGAGLLPELGDCPRLAVGVDVVTDGRRLVHVWT